MNWGTWVQTAMGCVVVVMGGAASAYGEVGTAPDAPLILPVRPQSPALMSSETPASVTLPPADISSRETSRLLYRAVHGSTLTPQPAWTGDVAACNPGTTEASYRDEVALRINYYRAMAGVPSQITFRDEFSAKAQHAALMMSRNMRLDHYPTSDWACYSTEGAEASGNSNLAVGRVGPGAIDGYMEDYGAANAPVGHRRWLLYPQTQTMGSGDIPATATQLSANATWVFDEHYSGPRPTTRDEFVAWPPRGYVPYPVMFPRWSFSLKGANFSDTTVTLASNGVPVAVELEPLSSGAGENTIVWRIAGMDATNPTLWPRPDTDITYTVNISNVKVSGGTSRDFTYPVVVFDPDVPGPDTILPTAVGVSEPWIGIPNTYLFTTVPAATGHEWLQGRRQVISGVEGAEGGLGTFTASTSPGYDPVVTDIKAAGSRSFHLAHAAPNTDQILTSTRVLLPGTTSELRFKEYLGAATTNQTGRVEVSLDDGLSWTELYSHTGSSGGGFVIFQDVTIPLGSYADRLVRLRFNYHHEGGVYYPQTDTGVGWYLDDITFVNVDEVKNVAVAAVPPGSTDFRFTPPAAGVYLLAVRGAFLERYPLEWGPPLPVSASSYPPVIRIQGRPARTNGRLEMEFTVTGDSAGLAFVLLSATDPDGPWTPEAQATFTSLDAGTRFKVSTPDLGRSLEFYQVRGE